VSPSVRKLTPLQEIEIAAWYRAKKALGTHKTKAREMGVTPSAISQCVLRMREREKLYVRKRARKSA
jgi:hypothetical protein